MWIRSIGQITNMSPTNREVQMKQMCTTCQQYKCIGWQRSVVNGPRVERELVTWSSCQGNARRIADIPNHIHFSAPSFISFSPMPLLLSFWQVWPQEHSAGACMEQQRQLAGERIQGPADQGEECTEHRLGQAKERTQCTKERYRGGLG